MISPRLLLLLSLIPLVGCAAPTSPLSSRSSTARVSAGQAATLGAGALTGAFIGDNLAGTPGALVGGAAGLAGGAVLHNAASSATDRKLAEAAEQARRDERLKIMPHYGRERTEKKTPDPSSLISSSQPLHYPAGTYDGLRFAPRFTTEPGLADPIR